MDGPHASSSFCASVGGLLGGKPNSERPVATGFCAIPVPTRTILHVRPCFAGICRTLPCISYISPLRYLLSLLLSHGQLMSSLILKGTTILPPSPQRLPQTQISPPTRRFSFNMVSRTISSPPSVSHVSRT